MSTVEEGNLSSADIGSSEPDLLDTNEPEVPDGDNQQLDEDTEEFSALQSPQDGEDDGAAMIAQWNERRRAEIEEKDAADEQEREELKEEAIKHIDDFYDSYNKKKEQQLETMRREAEEFSRQRETFSSQENTTTWDRALQLINEDDADVLGGRDRSKFKDILQRLKGNADAPGA